MPRYEARLGHGGTVFLAGLKLADCYACDTDAGWADVYLHRADGQVLVDWQRQSIVSWRLAGDVRFEPMERS